MENAFNEQMAQAELEKRYEAAGKMLNDHDKLERFLQQLEKKLKVIPKAGDKLAKVPIMVSLIRSFVKKEYTDIPIGSIIAITSALVYFVSPIDILPDALPMVGLIDDAIIIAVCLKLVESDVDEYSRWREDNGKVI